jgi:hypothetical protein
MSGPPDAGDVRLTHAPPNEYAPARSRPTDAEHVDVLRAALAEASVDGVRRAVALLAHALRADGLPPERMVIAVKQLLADAAMRPLFAGERETDSHAQCVRWAIEAYYDPTTRDGGAVAGS